MLRGPAATSRLALTDVVVVDRHPAFGDGPRRGGAVVDAIQRGAAARSGRGGLLWVSPSVDEGIPRRWQSGSLVVERVPVPIAAHAGYYYAVGAARIWPTLHGLQADLPADANGDDAWQAYVGVNDLVARAVARTAPRNARVTVHDYCLVLAVPRIRDLRPDLRLGYVHHTPWPQVDEVRDDRQKALLARLLAAAGAADVICVSAHQWRVNLLGWAPLRGVEVVNLGVDAQELRRRVAAADGGGWWQQAVGSGRCARPIVASVGRADPAKNADTVLRAWASLVERGQPGTFCLHEVPSSREEVPLYRSYSAAVRRAAEAANRARSGSVIVHTDENQSDALWLLQDADAVVACSRADGWNLVAAEAAVLGGDSQQIVLSSRMGVHELLGSAAYVVHDPTSMESVADALRTALADERAERVVPNRVVLPACADWWAGILSAVDAAGARPAPAPMS